MDFSFVPFLSLAFFLLPILFSLITTQRSHPPPPPPPIHGPPSYPLIGCIVSFYQNRRRLLDWYTQLLSESRTQTIILNRLGSRRTVITANPDNVEYMLKTNFSNYPKGKPFTEILGDFLGSGIFNVDGESWSSQRKFMYHELSARSLKEFLMKTLNEEVETRLLPVLEMAADTNTVLDLQDVFKRFTFDTICKVSLGMDFHCLDHSMPTAEMAAAFDGASTISAMRAVTPLFFVWKLKRALNVGSERKLKLSIELVHDSVMKIIELKKNKIGKFGENNLLSRLLSAGHDDEVVRDIVISFLMAGRDTTSAAMTWLFWLLSKHRKIEEALVEEVIELRNGEGPNNYDTLKEMRLVKACLCESMRLYPPVAWDSKHAAKDDLLPDGTPVYAGDRVTYFPYGMGRMEELWGKDRFEFRPDRWFDDLDKGSGGLRAVSPYKFPVFQAGPRVCLGKEMAFIQMKHVVVSVLRRFEIRPVCLDQPVFVPLLTAHMAGGFKVTVHRRNICSQS